MNELDRILARFTSTWDEKKYKETIWDYFESLIKDIWIEQNATTDLKNKILLKFKQAREGK